MGGKALRRVMIISSAVLIVVAVLISAFLLTSDSPSSIVSSAEEARFYVGVTYCGSSTAEAKLLIDRVKNYTNLFVLQSGPLQRDEAAIREIGDYAVASNMYFSAYYGTYDTYKQLEWLDMARQLWGKMFAGLYYGDEPGGKMLDSQVIISKKDTVEEIRKEPKGRVSLSNDSVNIMYRPTGEIIVSNRDKSSTAYPMMNGNTTIYYPNGTITFRENYGDFFTMENGTDRISQLDTYEYFLQQYPFKNYDEAAARLVQFNENNLERIDHRGVTVFTSDYGLYWWDYLSGYDIVLAQLGWNNTVAQEIGLVRGAANLQGKEWGTIITWKYTSKPYLADGDEIYEQMRMSYEAGAKYMLIFNYAQNMQGPYGTLQDNHFNALERFWREVVQNPNVTHVGVKAEAALVLPKNYGWGLRNSNDTIWGLWKPDDKSQQVWSMLQDSLAKYDSKLDIVYDDPAYPVAGRYTQIIYWNQTG